MYITFLSTVCLRIYQYIFLRAQKKVQRIYAKLQINLLCLGILELDWRVKEETVNFFYTFILFAV